MSKYGLSGAGTAFGSRVSSPHRSDSQMSVPVPWYLLVRKPTSPSYPRCIPLSVIFKESSR